MGSTGAQKVSASVKSYSQRDRLLPKSILQTLAESRDLDELVTRIKNTKYADSISKIIKPYTVEKIESILCSLGIWHAFCYSGLFRQISQWLLKKMS